MRLQHGTPQTSVRCLRRPQTSQFQVPRSMYSEPNPSAARIGATDRQPAIHGHFPVRGLVRFIGDPYLRLL